MTPNLTLDQIIEKALPLKNVTCQIEKRFKTEMRKELRAYLMDWHERMKADEQRHAVNNEATKIAY